MEIIVSAIMGELAGRSISFLIDKYSKPMAPTMEERLHSLQLLLLRVRVVVEEAEERHITNQAMLQQLNILRKEMYRGYYTLNSFRCRAHGENKVKDHEVSHSFALSKFRPAKRLRMCSGSSECMKELEKVVGSLETVVENVAEFIMLSGRYPRLCRQPYSMYLLFDKCMFGRQMEMEHVINFLLQADAPGAEHLGVLPIIGPGKVGKSTLVEHACIDERVRNHFSQIVLFSRDDLKNEDIVTLGDGLVIKNRNRAQIGERKLIIVELDGDIDEESWVRLYSASKGRLARDSKIIVTSRSDKIAGFGTALPLRLQFLSQEAYWYFFKVRTFGSMDEAEHPELASIAMDMARETNGCFVSASMYAAMMRSNANARFWSLTLATCRDFKRKNRFLYGAEPVDPWEVPDPIHIPTPSKTSPGYKCVLLDNYQTASAQDGGLIAASARSEAEAPKMMVQDVVFGSASPRGKFVALAWRSHIPPHYNYVFKCEIQNGPERVVSRKKKTHKIGST